MIKAGTIAGEFTRLEYPKSLNPGKDIEIKVDGNLVDLSKGIFDFWSGCFTAERTGVKDADRFSGNGTVIGPEWAPTLHLGVMPSASVTITVKMWANESYWEEWDWDRIAELGWEEIVTKTITIKGKAEEEEEGLPWKWIALGGGAVITAIVIAIAKGKK